MNSDNIADVICKTISKFTEANMTRNESDYVGSDGLLMCGVCNEAKESIFTQKIGNEQRQFKMARLCRCDREIAEQKKHEEERKKAKQKAMDMRKASLMDSRFFEATFSACQENKSNKKNIAMCRRYADAFDLMIEKNQGLLLYGDVGTGKSFAAACIANALLDKGVPVVMTSFVKLISIAENEDEQRTLSRIASTKLVVFDDLGAERGTDYAIERVYNIVDSRYRSNLPMIVTTNLTPKEMTEVDDLRYKRIYDRVLEVCYPIKFEGTNWRMKAARDRYNEMTELLGG